MLVKWKISQINNLSNAKYCGIKIHTRVQIEIGPIAQSLYVLVCADKDLGQFYQSPGEFKSVIINF